MADETYEDLKIGNIYAGGDTWMEWKAIATSEVLKPGHTCRVGSDDKLYAVKSTDGPASGFMALKNGQEIDTAYTVTSGYLYPYYPIGQKTLVWGVLEATSPAVAVRNGTKLIVGTEDGKVRAFPYTDGAEATDSDSHAVGRAVDIDAGSTTDDHIIKINIGAV